MKRILITGINGFLGKHLLDALLDNTNSSDIDKIVGIDNFISSKRDEKYKNNIKYNFIESDLIQIHLLKLFGRQKEIKKVKINILK